MNKITALKDLIIGAPMFILTNTDTNESLVCNEYTVRNAMLLKAKGLLEGRFTVSGVDDGSEAYKSMSMPSTMREDGILTLDVYRFGVNTHLAMELLKVRSTINKIPS